MDNFKSWKINNNRQELKDIIGKSWSQWDLAETVSESDLRRGRKLRRNDLGFDGSVEKRNKLPSAGMFLFGSYPESDILSISTCSGCKRKFKTQWLHSGHWVKTDSGDFICPLTKNVVVPQHSKHTLKPSSKHNHHLNLDSSREKNSSDDHLHTSVPFIPATDQKEVAVSHRHSSSSSLSKHHHHHHHSGQEKNHNLALTSRLQTTTKELMIPPIHRPLVAKPHNNHVDSHHHHHQQNSSSNISTISSTYTVVQPTFHASQLHSIQASSNGIQTSSNYGIQACDQNTQPLNSIIKEEVGNSNNGSSTISHDQNPQSAEVKQVHVCSLPPKKKKKAKNEPRKIVPLKDRKFDPDQHCGVPSAENGNRCTRSLTCKTHSMALRRAVPGRRINFDQLLLDHKKVRDAERAAKAALDQYNGVVPSPAATGRATLPIRVPQTSPTMTIAPVPLLNTTAVPIMGRSTLPLTTKVPMTTIGSLNTITPVTIKTLPLIKKSQPNVVNFVAPVPASVEPPITATTTSNTSTANSNNNYVPVKWSQPVTPLMRLPLISGPPRSNNISSNNNLTRAKLPLKPYARGEKTEMKIPIRNTLPIVKGGEMQNKSSEERDKTEMKIRIRNTLPLKMPKKTPEKRDNGPVLLSSVLNTSDIPLVCINTRTLKVALKERKRERTFKVPNKYERAAKRIHTQITAQTILMDLCTTMTKKSPKKMKLETSSTSLTNGRSINPSPIHGRVQTVKKININSYVKFHGALPSVPKLLERHPLDEINAQDLRDAASLIQSSAQTLCRYPKVETTEC